MYLVMVHIWRRWAHSGAEPRRPLGVGGPWPLQKRQKKTIRLLARLVPLFQPKTGVFKKVKPSSAFGEFKT